MPKFSQDRGGRRLQNAVTVAVWCLAAGLLTETLILARHNERLKKAPPPPSLGSLFVTPGEMVGELAGVGPQGRYERVALPGVGSYMLVATLSPGCLSCTEEATQLKLLLGSAPKPRPTSPITNSDSPQFRKPSYWAQAGWFRRRGMEHLQMRRFKNLQRLWRRTGPPQCAKYGR